MAAESNSISPHQDENILVETSPDEPIFVENEDRQADDKFIDDLIAANDMKSYILSAGHDLEEDVITNLNRLYSIFRSDIEARRARIDGIVPSLVNSNSNQNKHTLS